MATEPMRDAELEATLTEIGERLAYPRGARVGLVARSRDGLEAVLTEIGAPDEGFAPWLVAKAQELGMEIAAAYPRESKLESWRRVIRLDRASNEVVVRDTARFSGPGEVTLNLMTTSEKNIERIQCDGPGVERKVDEVIVEDRRLQSAWGSRLYRVRLVSSKAPASASWLLRVKA